MVQRSPYNWWHSTRTFNTDKDYKQINEQKMNYTEQEREMIAEEGHQTSLGTDTMHDELVHRIGFKAAFYSETMQQIIESRIKQDKITFIEDTLALTKNNDATTDYLKEYLRLIKAKK